MNTVSAVYRTKTYYTVLIERFVVVKGGWLKIFYNTAYTTAAAQQAPEQVIIPLLTKQYGIVVYCDSNSQFNGSKYVLCEQLPVC